MLTAFTSLSSDTKDGFERLLAVIPDILFPEHLDIALPSFLLAIEIDPCGYVVGGFMIVPTPNYIKPDVSLSTKFYTVTTIEEEVRTYVH